MLHSGLGQRKWDPIPYLGLSQGRRTPCWPDLHALSGRPPRSLCYELLLTLTQSSLPDDMASRVCVIAACFVVAAGRGVFDQPNGLMFSPGPRSGEASSALAKDLKCQLPVCTTDHPHSQRIRRFCSISKHSCDLVVVYFTSELLQ